MEFTAQLDVDIVALEAEDEVTCLVSLTAPVPEAIAEKVITRGQLDARSMEVAVGARLDVGFLNEYLFELHFERVDFVEKPGQFSVRGGIVDVFSFAHPEPHRLEFFAVGHPAHF